MSYEDQLIREMTTDQGLPDPEDPNESTETGKQLTCERCGNKTDGGAWLGFVYVGAECLTNEDREYIE